MPTVYPRWRGEHAVVYPLRNPRARFIPAGAGNTLASGFLVIYVVGLSPLARGTRECSPSKIVARRFIPAGAGNTLEENLMQVKRPVYPRWRGEHQWCLSPTSATAGLSPLARGTREFGKKNVVRLRFIPAGAGNTNTDYLLTHGSTVYPRWRGEHCYKWHSIYYSAGLSPLARGTLDRAR